jgi:predicted transcriptional regulator
MRVSEIAEELRSTGFVSRAQQLEPVVATYLNRLMKKGLVERDESQPVYRYRLKSHSDVAVTTSEEKGG